MPSGVLIIDDAPFMRERFRALLEAGGIPVAGEAAGGEEGLALLEGLEPDLVLLDLWMPFLSGVEVLRRIRQARPDLPVLVYDAMEAAGRIQEAVAAGASDFFVKPFEDGDVRALVERLRA